MYGLYTESRYACICRYKTELDLGPREAYRALASLGHRYITRFWIAEHPTGYFPIARRDAVDAHPERFHCYVVDKDAT